MSQPLGTQPSLPYFIFVFTCWFVLLGLQHVFGGLAGMFFLPSGPSEWCMMLPTPHSTHLVPAFSLDGEGPCCHMYATSILGMSGV